MLVTAHTIVSSINLKAKVEDNKNKTTLNQGLRAKIMRIAAQRSSRFIIFAVISTQTQPEPTRHLIYYTTPIPFFVFKAKW